MSGDQISNPRVNTRELLQQERSSDQLAKDEYSNTTDLLTGHYS